MSNAGLRRENEGSGDVTGNSGVTLLSQVLRSPQSRREQGCLANKAMTA
jgi:hypothetical protein